MYVQGGLLTVEKYVRTEKVPRESVGLRRCLSYYVFTKFDR